MTFKIKIKLLADLEQLGFPAIITRFYLKTRPYLPAFKKQLFFWPISEYDAAMKWVVEVSDTLALRLFRSWLEHMLIH